METAEHELLRYASWSCIDDGCGMLVPNPKGPTSTENLRLNCIESNRTEEGDTAGVRGGDICC